MIKKKIAKLAIALTLVTSFVIGPVTSSYTVVEANTSQQELAELETMANDLRAKIKENRIRAKACELLLDRFPHLVQSVRGELLKLVDDSVKVRESSQKTLEKVEKYLGDNK